MVLYVWFVTLVQSVLLSSYSVDSYSLGLHLVQKKMTVVQVHIPLQDLVFLTSPFLCYKHPHTHA